MLNYTDLADQVMRDATHRVRDLGHIDPDRVAVLAAARCSSQHTGNLANCCGLRNEPRPTFSIWTRNGSRQIVAVSQWFQAVVPRVRLGGRQMTYLIQLRMPRILLTNPLETLIHELYHIGVEFDGRMRPVRHGAFFDAEVRRLMQAWLRVAPRELARQAQLTFPQLVREHGAVVGLGIPTSFKVPYMEALAAPEPYAAGVERLYPGYRLAAGWQIRRGQLNKTEPLTVLSEKDLVLRHYDREGTRRLPRIYTRYTRNQEAISA